MEHLAEIIYTGKGKLFQGNSKVIQTYWVALERLELHSRDEKGKQLTLRQSWKADGV